MAKECQICHKGPMFGNSLSHSHKASRKKWDANVQRVKAQTEQGVKRIWVCSQCLRSGRVRKVA